MTDRLQRSMFDAVTRAARARGQAAPQPDARLEAFAATLARTLGPDEVPGVELQEFLLSHFGLGEPIPELAMLQVILDDDIIQDKVREQPAPGAGRRAVRAGGDRPCSAGSWDGPRWWWRCSGWSWRCCPSPAGWRWAARRWWPGGCWRACAIPGCWWRRRAGARCARCPSARTGDSFQTSFRCDDGTGRYQVEIVGVGRAGKTVVANFPVHCGVAPPRSAPRVAIGRPESDDPRQAEQLLLAAVNRDRAAVGLPALEWDEPLARAARAYSDEMAERQLVEHVSPRSGNAADRVRRAGARANIVLENVARANSIADAQKSFMSSPGHRANVLSRQVTRLGTGVTIRKESGGVPSLYVTQLYAR